MIKVNSAVSNVNRIKSKYGLSGNVRLHASERDLEFDEQLWNCFVSLLSQDDFKLYPNVDKAYDILSQLINVNKENLTIAEGSDRILKNIFECFSVPGFKVISTNPCFPMYKIYTELQEADFVVVDYSCEQFPLDNFLKEIDSQTSLVVLSNPSSPVGDLISNEQLLLIAERCNKFNCLLVVDEAYIEFSNAVSARFLIDNYNLIVVRTFSKAHGVAGLRIGYAVSNSLIKNYLVKVSSMNELNGIAVKWLEALTYFSDTDHYISIVKKHREKLLDLLKAKGIVYIDSQTNYVNILGDLHFENILTKKSLMPWNQQVYTRVSIPAKLDNFNKLLLEIQKL
jgi:histidinol-phosphate aminotransferase